MKVLYAAIDQMVPGTTGGSVHVAAVAEGLAGLGHDVTALITSGENAPRPSRVRWVPMAPPFGSSHLRLLRSGDVRRLAEAIRPDAIIERYHNFGGEGIRAATKLKTVAVLEVNAPVIDHPGSSKALLDRAVVLEPMRRWREYLCAMSDLIVTPNREILPRGIPLQRIQVLEWGADTELFRPDAGGDPPFIRPPVDTLAVFAGAFRSWHGAIHLVEAIKVLRARGRRDIGAVLIGDGAELPRVRQAARGLDTILITGALPHDRMPAALAAADIGVAPFEIGAHPPLQLGFFWSPLKMFEYMASGLPVVAPRVDRIPSLIADEREGLLYDPSTHAEALADALVRLSDPAVRRPLGTAARQRAERDYSWQAHCRALESSIVEARVRRLVHG